MSALPAAKNLAFAGFSLEPESRRLIGPDGAEVAVQPRVFDLLMLFVARPGQLLAKSEIMEAVWPDTTVDENNLNQAISVLRRALGDSPSSPRLIATVPRRGYQFIAPVSAEGGQPTATGLRALAARLVRSRTGLAAGAAVLLAALTLAVFAVPRLAPAPAQETADAQAWEHYLRGRAYLGQSGVAMLSAAVGEFEKATELDPGFGSAWVSMARAADSLEIEQPQLAQTHRAIQREAVARAGEAAPDRWETIAVRAQLLMRERRWAEAAQALEAARGAAPPSPADAAAIEGAFLMQTGRPREASALLRAGRESDPLSFALAARLAWALDMAGDREAALAEYAHARTLPGDETAWAYQQLLRLMQAGEARAVDDWLATYPYSDDGVGLLMRQLPMVWRSPGDALGVLWTMLDSGAVTGPHRLDALALLAAHYGDEDLALRLMREEFFTRGGGSTAHLWNPAMAEIRRTEGFRALVRDLGLADYWRSSGDWPEFCAPVSASDFACR